MFGKNPKRKPIAKYEGFFELKEIVPTFQGEGPYVGWPAVFVRLGGCNLACSFCDTEFEDFKKVSIQDLVAEIVEKSELDGKKKKLVVITGGEPLRQPIEILCKELLDKGFLVQIETNGTLYRKLPSEVTIVCSPKVVNGRYNKVHPEMIPQVNYYKFLISSKVDGYKDVPEYVKEFPEGSIYVQPMDEIDAKKNEINKKLALKVANMYGFKISVQTHKYLDIY